MYIHCLTKLMLYDEFEDFLQRKGGYSNDPSSDEYYKNIREEMFFKELKNSDIFAYSEIRIGKAVVPGNEYANFYLLLFRNNVMVGKFKLEDKMMKIRSIETTVNDKIINIEIDKKAINSPFYCWTYNNRYQNTIKEIQIQCIKAFKKGEKTIPLKTQNQFKEYANKINELALTFNDPSELNEEKAFKIMGPLKVPDESGKRVVGQKIRDLCDAIEVLCNSEKRIHKNARFNYPIEIQLDFAFFKRVKKNRKPSEKSTHIDYKIISQYPYDERTDVTRDFSTVCTLHYEDASISTINLRWFNAPALTWLTFKNCRLFEIPNAWKIFEENIGKFQNLHILKISDCHYLTEIPGTLFSKLPKSIDSLIFDGNSITEISEEISEVKKLRYLNLEKNHNLSNLGIPWEVLPETLEVLFVKNTAVKKLPASKIERLKNLKQIDFPVYQLEEINVDELVEKFSGISMDIKNPFSCPEGTQCNACMKGDHSGHTTFIFESKKKYELTLNRRDLETYPWETLSDTLTNPDLSNNKLTNIGSMKHLKNLETLSLSVNQISKINGNLLPESVKTVDFSYNLLKDISFLECLKNLKELWICDNQIETILWENLPESLESINIFRNKLTNIGSLKHLKNLQTLSLLGNQITSVLWEDFPSELKYLNLAGNKIQHVDSLKHLKKLETLMVEGNQTISIQWESLPESLKELVIYENCITYMGSMKHLQNLKFLNAHTNQMETVKWECLPESLPSLFFSENRLTHVGSIKHLKNLYELKLNNNQISSILWEDFPPMLQHSGISNSPEINLSHNLLTCIGSMSHLKDVKDLRLDHNKMTSIQWDFLPPNVKNLYLSHNHISTLYGSKTCLTKLKYLDLGFNQLTKIDAEIFTFPNLDRLYLNDNAITEIIAPTISNLNNFELPTLDLSFNAFNFETSENLTEKLWNNLPFCENLFLNGNNLVEIPCPLVGKFTNLYAVDCNFEYICPKLTIYSAINLIVGNNPKLSFPFHPRLLIPFQYPKCDNADFNFNEHTFIIGDFKNFSKHKKV